ncbi:T9SS type A sorting domain-containing protein [bacterium SCSIO 12741]|nr:T9SS type A sorting domain-containing protein [bacterium SCSIO 12741]
MHARLLPLLLLGITFLGGSLRAQDGTLDSTFGSGGIYTSTDTYGAVKIDRDGSLFVGGYFSTFASDFSLTKLKPEGIPDSTFGTHGRAVTRVPQSHWNVARDLAILPDGKILFAGDGDAMGVVMKFEADGSLDTTFGDTGFVINRNMSLLNAMVVHYDDKILVGGQSFIVASTYFTLAQYNLDGTPDLSFGNGGVVNTDLSSARGQAGNDNLKALALQADGKILACGQKAGDSLALVRYLRNGDVDSTFGINGVADIEQEGIFNSVTVQYDGKIIAAGRSGANDIIVVRFDPSGSLDTDFGQAGVVETSLTLDRDEAHEVAVQSDKKIVVCGRVQMNLEYHLALIRYDIYGQVDSTFGTNGITITDLTPMGMGAEYSMILQPERRIVVSANGKVARYRNSLVSWISYPASLEPVTIYPNPTSRWLNVVLTEDLSDQVTLDLYNQNGALVRPMENGFWSAKGSYSFAIDDLPSGMYTLKLTQNGEQRYFKVVKR